MDWLEELIKLTLFTGYVKNRLPVSLLIIAKPAQGKTAVVSQYSNNDKIMECVDFTGHGIKKKIVPEIRKDGYKHLIIPDFIKVLTSGQSITWNVVALFSSLMEEGYSSSATYHEDFDATAKGKKVNIGIITTITPKYLSLHKKRFSDVGFLSRMICVKYEYSGADVLEIMNLTDNEVDDKSKFKKDIMLDFPDASISVKFIKDKLDLRDYRNDIFLIAQELTMNNIDENGIRLNNMFKTLMKANAIIEERTEVNQEDVDKIHGLMKHLYKGEKVSTNK